MTKQVLNRGTIANDGTGDTLRTSALKIQQNFDEIYNKLGDGSVLMSLIDFDSDAIVFEGRTADNFETRLRADDPTADREVRIPNYGGSLVMDSATQTLANKTLLSPVLTTPQFNDTSSNHQYVVSVNELSADRTVALPLLTGNDEFTFNSHTQTLANKTIQRPTINSPIIGDKVLDSAGAELLVFTKASNAVNYVSIENSGTGVPVTIQGAGEANTSLSLEGTGNGGVRINSRLALKTQGLNSAGTVNAGDPVTLFNNASPATHTLANGTTSVNGEIKYLVNKGAGTQTVNETSNNLAAYSSIELTQNDAVTLMWFGSQWIVINNQGATLNV
jgi:hypothetical protein